MKYQEIYKDKNKGKGYYKRGTESYINWLEVLVDRLRPYDVTIQKITEWQYRINGTLDLYPVNRRYHNIKTGKRGDYLDFVSFTVRYFNLKKSLTNERT